MERIYLDYAASTPVDPEVLRAMEPYFMGKFGNPGSLHFFGQEAIAAVDRSRESIARSIGADFRQFIFTGSATEANNLALRGAIKKFYEVKKAEARNIVPRIIVSTIEHESVLETAKELQGEGVEVVYAPVDARGVVDEKFIKENLTADTVLVSVMYANNEIGTIQPVSAVAKAVKDFRGMGMFPLFHTDAAQAFQFLDCDIRALGADLMTVSAHKIYGPKGIGGLYIKGMKAVRPVTFGGGQEFGLRSGTENVPAIVGFAKAAEIAVAAREKESKRIGGLTEELWQGIKKVTPDAEINGVVDSNERLPNILNIYFPRRAAQDLLTKFDLAGLAVSSGSACHSRALEASYVIAALGYNIERAKASIRFSLGRLTTKAEIASAVKLFSGAVV
jgi:cysteine desulfurase